MTDNINIYSSFITPSESLESLDNPVPSATVEEFAYVSSEFPIPEFGDSVQARDNPWLELVLSEGVIQGYDIVGGAIQVTSESDFYGSWLEHYNYLIRSTTVSKAQLADLESNHDIQAPDSVIEMLGIQENIVAWTPIAAWAVRAFLDFNTPYAVPTTKTNPFFRVHHGLQPVVTTIFVRRIEIDVENGRSRWIWGVGFTDKRDVIPEPMEVAAFEATTQWAVEDPDGTKAFQKLVDIGNQLRISQNWP